MIQNNPFLARQLDFLVEVDRLKSIERANLILSCDRPENSAEHSWHLAVYALIFGWDAPSDVDVDRAIAMLLLHDIVEIDAGDHPIHLDFDPAEIEAAERRAADRIFGILPTDQAAEFNAIWTEFEANETPTAQFAKCLDVAHPMFQTLYGAAPDPTHIEIVRKNVGSGRARQLSEHWAEAYDHGLSLLSGSPTAASAEFLARLTFLNEACALKSVYRATKLCDESRRENSGEHSWHIALYALTLADQARADVDITQVIRMLLIHDLVEIDVGDVPIHSAGGKAHHSEDTQAAEARAADRLFGLLPTDQGAHLRALWDEFEAVETPDAVFAKSLDRVQPLAANLEGDGGSWTEYNVTYDQLVGRVGEKIERGAPTLWAEIDTRIRAHPWFARQFD